MIIGTLAEGGEDQDRDQDRDQDEGQVGIAMTMTTILEMAGGRSDEDVVEDVIEGVVPEVFLRREDGEEDEDAHQQREESSLFLPTMACPLSPLNCS